MVLRDILRRKGSKVHSISPEATLDEVVHKLVENKVGSLVVCDPSGEAAVTLQGIITERDILRACATRDQPLAQVRVHEMMSTELRTGTPDDSIEETMGLMTERRIRHLPIMEEGRLAGMISIGDVVKAHYEEVTMENHYLKSYIQS